MKTSSIAVETSRSTSQSDSIVRQTNKRSFLSDTTMNNIHIFNNLREAVCKYRPGVGKIKISKNPKKIQWTTLGTLVMKI